MSWQWEAAIAGLFIFIGVLNLFFAVEEGEALYLVLGFCGIIAGVGLCFSAQQDESRATDHDRTEFVTQCTQANGKAHRLGDETICVGKSGDVLGRQKN